MNHFKRISVNDADRILANNPDVLLLDIRNEREFKERHHPRAQLLTDTLLRKIIRNVSKSVPLVIYCYHGNSSQDIAHMFAEFGFKETYSVDGGYAAWRHQVEEKFPQTEQLRNWMTHKGYLESDINGRIDSENRTPLMIASRNGRDDIVHDLVEAGADPNLTDEIGNNALWYACIGQSIPCAIKLINADVEVENRNIFGFTALNYAVGIDDLSEILKNNSYSLSLSTAKEKSSETLHQNHTVLQSATV